jgi:hypothetical protein
MMSGRHSTYREIRDAVFENPYYNVWGAPGEPPLPVYRVTLRSVLAGILPGGKSYQFLADAGRTIDSKEDLRWGPDRRGHRRLLHPNGVCLFGKWQINEEATDYTGYFQPRSEALLVARYSSCCSEVRRGRRRSLSMVGKLFPTTDPDHAEPLPTASFITQEDLGGDTHGDIRDAEFLNAPNTTAWRRGWGVNGLSVILLTGLVFRLVDREPSQRQLYEIAELGKPQDVPTNAPRFLKIVADRSDERTIEGSDLDFREELLARMYDRGVREPQRDLVFHIEVSDEGATRGPAFFQRRHFGPWRRIGRLVFHEAVASYNGDFVIHFHHPTWRRERNDVSTVVRKGGQRNR